MLDTIKRNAFGLCLSVVLLWGAIEPSFAQSSVLAVKAQQAYMVDGETGTVLLAVNETAPFPPASLAKLMTVDLVWQALKDGKVAPETSYPVSEYAWRSGGAPSRTSTMFAALKSSISVRDLVTGIVVQNANDACIVLAEGMAGSEAVFARQMTERARLLGMTASVFANATGLPDPSNVTTAKDMVVLARHLHETAMACSSCPISPGTVFFSATRIPCLRSATVLTASVLALPRGMAFPP